MNNPLRWDLRAALALVAGVSLIPLAVAQTPTSTPAPSASDEAVKLEKMIVTGSNIPTAADAVAVPVTILSRIDLEQTGLDTNLLEVLQKRMPIFAGNGNLGVTNSNVGANSTYGGSQVSIRNLATLVLLDGLRLPDSGANARGGRAFVDVNQIPMAAIQSIEVVTDGASAIYGSDAVGGVVNIKLRHDFEGAEIGGRYGFSSAAGDYEEKSAYVVVGAKEANGGVVVSASWSKITPLYQADRDFSSPIVGRTATISGAVSASSATFPSHFLRPDLGSPSQAVPTGTAATAANLAALQAMGVYGAASFQSIADTFDLSPLVTLTLESEKKAATLAAAYDIVPGKLKFSLEGLYSDSVSFSQLAAQPVTSTVPVNSPYNPTTSSIFAAFRYVPAPRQFENSGVLQRMVARLDGDIADRFQWEIAYNHNSNKLTNYVHNVLYAPNLALAIAGGYDAAGNPQVGGKYARVFRDFGAPPGLTTLAQYQAAVTTANSILQPALDVFARPGAVAADSITNIFGASSAIFDSGLQQFNANIAGPLFDLPGGSLDAALGVDYRIEELVGNPDANSYSSGPTAGRWSGATFFNPFNKDRDITGAYAEVRVPITGKSMNIPGLKVLELSAAYRFEDYSDAGESNVPKYGVRWQPFDEQLMLRATYSEAFSAPSLFSLFGPTTQGFTATTVIPSVFGVNGQAQSRGGSNPNLKPSTAETLSYGMVFSPKFVKGLTVTVDYVDVEQVDLIGSAGSAEILRSVNAMGTASPYISQVAIGNWPTNPDPNLPAATFITAPGQLAAYLAAGNSANQFFLTDSSINIAGQKVEALDVSVTYDIPWDDYGRFRFNTTGTFFLDYLFQALPSQPYYEYANHVTNGGTGSQGTTPGTRFYTTLAYAQGPWDLLVGNTYIGEMTDIGPGGITFATSTTLQRRPVEAYSVWDIAASYTFGKKAVTGEGARGYLRGLRLTVGVNNVGDKMPILTPQAYNESNADVSTYSPIGRFYYLSAKYAF